MIDPDSETLITLSRARIPGNPHIATRWRWATRGVGGTKLETMKCGGRRLTSQEAVARFLQRLNEPGAVSEPPSAAAEKAGERLKARGA
jgi:hypothetical protein